MNQFYRNELCEFIYDGKSSKKIANLFLCDVSDADNTVTNGLSRNISYLDSNSDIKDIGSVTNEYITKSITLTKLDEYGDISGFTQEELHEINRWLFGGGRKFKPLEQDGITYYVIFKSSQRWMNNAAMSQGYIECEIEMLPYCYSYIYEKTVGVTNPNNNIVHKTFTISNESNVDENDICLNLKVQMFDDCDYLKIENITNGTIFSITLDSNSGIEYRNFKVLSEDVYGRKMHMVESTINPDLNIMEFVQKKKWLKLSYGVNTIRISSKRECSVKFKYRHKMQIQ